MEENFISDRSNKEDKLLTQIEKNKDKAEKLLKDNKKMEDFLERLERKLSKVPKVGKYLSDVPVLISLVNAYRKKEYTEIPVLSMVAIVSTLIYVLTPFDLIFDGAPGVGLLDDAGVVAVASNLINDDLREYKAWREEKNNIINL